MNVSTSSIVVASQEQVSCDLDGESVILSMKNGVYYGLDPVGARVWTLIQSPTPLGEVRDAILAEYDVEPARCEADLCELVESLSNEGLVEVRNEASA